MKPLLLLAVSLFSLRAQTIAPEGFRGSAQRGAATAAPIELSLQEAISRGLSNNIGLLVRGTDASDARIDRMRALSALLPNVEARISQYEAQNNLTTFGIQVPGFPSVVGPFNYFDARAALSSPVFDWSLLKRAKAAAEYERAAQLSVDDGRDVVVAAVASGYFAILADIGRVDVTRSQVTLAQALFNIARDSHLAGVVPAIDELRAQVEVQKQQQTLLFVENQLAKDKLALARVIGLPSGQEFNTTDTAPYKALTESVTDELLQRAYRSRTDYQSIEAKLKASEISVHAADAARYPIVGLDANYGASGPVIGNSHGVFTIAGTLKFNIFDSGRIRAEQDAAHTQVDRRKNDLADLKGKIDFEVRNALVDLKTASDQVGIAQVARDLANQELVQARDRYVAGVGSGLELVQAEVSLANTNQDLISAAYAHNLAKVQLARAVGATQMTLKEFMGDNK
jgi:outer membrane protein TolC